MNDQLMDASNKGLLLDVMQYWLAMPAWWITRMLILMHEACAVVLSVVMRGAFATPEVGLPGWVELLTATLIGTWYSRALALGMLGLGLTFMLIGSGMRIKLVQPRAFGRWTLVMVLLAIAAPSLYGTTIQLITQVPALVMPPIVDRLPPIRAAWITVAQDGDPVAPFDPANPAYASRAAVLAVPPTASSCATMVTSGRSCDHPMYAPLDAVLALWRTDRTSLISGIDGITHATPDGSTTVQLDGLPPDFAALFYPDATQPWYGGAFTTDPSGMQKRREALNTASIGTLHAVAGVLAALATLMPTLAQALMTVCGALLFLLGIVVAPIGMFGNQRHWVAVVYRSFFTISGWQTVLVVGTNLATFLLFGTPDEPGIAMAYPTMLVVLPLFVWVQWRVLRFAMRLSWQGFAAVRTVVSREPLQRLLGDQPAAATEARVAATGHYTATSDTAAMQPTLATTTLARDPQPHVATTALASTQGMTNTPSTQTSTRSALPSLINPRGLALRMQQTAQRTVQRVQQVDHQIEVTEARMLRSSEVRTDTQLDRADQAITTMIGGKTIAAGVTYAHENEVMPEWLFAPASDPASARSASPSPRVPQSHAARPAPKSNGAGRTTTAERPTETAAVSPTQELPTRAAPRSARPPAADQPPTQPLIASAAVSATPTPVTKVVLPDDPMPAPKATVASTAHGNASGILTSMHTAATAAPITQPSAAQESASVLPTPPTQELPAAAPIRGTVAPPPVRQQTPAQPAAPRTPEVASSAPRGPQRPPAPASVSTNENGLGNSTATSIPAATSHTELPTPSAQSDASAAQATPAVATATHTPMEPAAPMVEPRTPQATTRPARSRSRVGMPVQGQLSTSIIDITKEGQPTQPTTTPPVDTPLIAPRSENRGRR
ncbi:hypothetical protein [Herpetosiphon geysericola]|uniref:Uncharacterized protein n=1 Tax=Herpetosiphon geysericola TaxID=70996 RepID=A0A0P6XBT7_9CHLR|nr:hypothetical protein [Herpetosiphon geysericola]KPL79685.1 hypothetical protein SE18_26060 [Herpetosiphon geysericola]